jgi:hypothetical protein
VTALGDAPTNDVHVVVGGQGYAVLHRDHVGHSKWLDAAYLSGPACY